MAGIPDLQYLFPALPGGIPLRYNMGIGNSVVFLTGNPFLRNTVGNGLADAPWLRSFLFSKPVLQQRFDQSAELPASFKKAHLDLAPNVLVDVDGHLHVVRAAVLRRWPSHPLCGPHCVPPA